MERDQTNEANKDLELGDEEPEVEFPVSRDFPWAEPEGKRERRMLGYTGFKRKKKSAN